MAKPQSDIPPRRKNNAGPAKPATKAARDRRPPKRRPGRSSRLIYGGAAAAAVALIVVLIVVATSGGGSKSKKVDTTSSAINWKSPAGTQVYGALGPESVPLEVGDALGEPNTGLTGATLAGISCGTTEQTAYHIHVHLALFVNGQPKSVPLGIGITPPAAVSETPKGAFAEGSGATNGCFYWMHTHAQDGIIHIESPITKIFELGQFFGVWQQPLSSTQMGPYKGTVTATVNGKAWSGDPASIPLNKYDDIVLNLGSPTVTPPQVSFSGTGL